MSEQERMQNLGEEVRSIGSEDSHRGQPGLEIGAHPSVQAANAFALNAWWLKSCSSKTLLPRKSPGCF